MSQILKIPYFEDDRGTLSVIDQLLPFSIARVYYIYEVSKLRGFHRHRYSQSFVVAIKGKVEIEVQTQLIKKTFILDTPREGLLLAPEDWIKLEFSSDAILLCMSSHPFSVDDYIYEVY